MHGSGMLAKIEVTGNYKIIMTFFIKIDYRIDTVTAIHLLTSRQ
jgi:hypothetical protein